MRDGMTTGCRLEKLPSWVPRPALNYIAHTESGTTIRALARRSGCHASTVLRQIRRYEVQRDDLLVDQALRRLGRQVVRKADAGSPKEEIEMAKQFRIGADEQGLSEARLEQEARRILRSLCETGAVLAVAVDMDKAVVVRETAAGGTARTAIADREVAEAMALKEWISCAEPARVSRYQITRQGREALNRMVAEAENEALGFAEAQSGFDGPDAVLASPDSDRPSRRNRYNLAETPITALARRKDRDGMPFLAEPLVRAGERLREDFELARLGPRDGQNWDQYLTEDAGDGSETAQHDNASNARARVAGALRDLGPGLGDVVLRCCCYLEGLEQTEKTMGWSARSGKIVLRIALQRLKRHYELLGDSAGMIG